MPAQTRGAQERYALVAQAASERLWVWNLTADELYFSPRWKAMFATEPSSTNRTP